MEEPTSSLLESPSTPSSPSPHSATAEASELYHTLEFLYHGANLVSLPLLPPFTSECPSPINNSSAAHVTTNYDAFIRHLVAYQRATSTQHASLQAQVYQLT